MLLAIWQKLYFKSALNIFCNLSKAFDCLHHGAFVSNCKLKYCSVESNDIELY